MTSKQTLTCRQPDRDCAGLVCGYPLPCPWHTAIINLSSEPAKLEIPLTATAALGHRGKLEQIADVLLRFHADDEDPTP